LFCATGQLYSRCITGDSAFVLGDWASTADQTASVAMSHGSVHVSRCTNTIGNGAGLPDAKKTGPRNLPSLVVSSVKTESLADVFWGLSQLRFCHSLNVESDSYADGIWPGHGLQAHMLQCMPLFPHVCRRPAACESCDNSLAGVRSGYLRACEMSRTCWPTWRRL
jgi:hypothetical protein